MNRSINRNRSINESINSLVSFDVSAELAIGDHCDSRVQSPNDQCVENAACTGLNRSCTCKPDYYRADSFTCKKREWLAS